MLTLVGLLQLLIQKQVLLVDTMVEEQAEMRLLIAHMQKDNIEVEQEAAALHILLQAVDYYQLFQAKLMIL